MRQILSTVLALSLALATGGCGVLENAPFRVGAVRGRLTESDPAVALVSRLGTPELRATVAEDGSFSLEGVPAGPGELFIIASSTRAVRLGLTVPGGETLDLGEVRPRAASFLDLRVRTSTHQQVVDGRASVLGTPLQELQLNAGGALRVGPLPGGCYSLDVSAAGFSPTVAEACLNDGESEALGVKLHPPKDKPVSGCTVSTCETGTLCALDGRCIECLEDAHCAPGFACRGERCEGPGAFCAPCTGDWQCKVEARCEFLPEGSDACVARCDKQTPCPQGFSCQSNGLCLPVSSQMTGCAAYQKVGAPCTGDAYCREQGLPQGRCVESTCTFPCGSSAECPEGFTCAASAVGDVCRKLP